MKVLSQNMSLAEIIFLYLGIFLFIVLTALLIIYVVQKRDLKVLVIFFIIPIIMIGWPSISNFKVSADGIELNKKLIEDATTDSSKRGQLSFITDSLNNVNLSDPDSLKLLAQANAVLGDTLTAVDKIDIALEKNPTDKEAMRLKRIYFTPDIRIQKEIENVIENPEDEVAKSKLKNTLKAQEESPSMQADPLRVAAAHFVLKDTAKSNIILENVIRENPELINEKQAKIIMKDKYLNR